MKRVACECDYDWQGEEDGYVKCSRHCPIHDECTDCDMLGAAIRLAPDGKLWLCDKCWIETQAEMKEATK